MPFNLVTVPFTVCCTSLTGGAGHQDEAGHNNRQEHHDDFSPIFESKRHIGIFEDKNT